MATNYSPTIVTDGAVFVGDARMPSISEPGTRLYNRAGVDSADVKLLIQGNVGSAQSFSDSSLSNHTVTANGDVTHSTTQSKFSGGSIYFDGTGDYLSVPDSSDWAFGTDDFTIDFWFNPTGFASYTGLIVQNPTTFGSTDSWYGLFIEVDNSSTKLRLFIRNGPPSDMFTEISQTGIVAGTWYHVAVVRETGANKITMYLNGTSVGSSTWSGSTSYPDFATPLLIGVRNDQSDYFSGYMDEVRITKGAALWTQDFTPPARRDTLSISDGMMYNGTCFDFDGTDDLVLTSDPVITGTGDFTLTAWINRATVNTYDYVCGNYGSGNTGGIEVYGKTNGTVILYIGAPLTTSTVMTAGTWYHFAATRTSGVCKLYMNGVLDVSGTLAGSIVGSNNFSIGNGADYTSENFDGKIADVKAFNVALSAANIKELYDDSKVIIPTKNAAAGGFVSQTNLIGWWPLAEGAGDICYDGSGNGYHGTASNTDGDEWLTGRTGCPQLVGGYNRKLLFSGDDYVGCGNNSSLNFTTGNFSVSCWIYIHDLTDVGYIVRRGSWGLNGWYTYLTTSGTIQIYTNDSAQGDPHTQTVSNSSVITANTWHHVVWVRNGATGVIYVDGTDETASGDSMIDPATSTNTCYIGSATNYISGIVDEVIVYDTVVTSSQAAALHATDANGGPLPPDPMSGASGLPSSSNVVSYWRNEGSGTWTDRGNNSNDGTPAGTPTTLLFKQGINGSASISTGRDNQGFPLKYKDVGAIGFNGSDNLIDIPHSTVFDSTVFSYCSWVYVPGDTTADGKVAHLSNNSAGNGWGTWQIRSSTTTNQLYYQTNNAGTWQTYTMNNYFTGAGWYYICVTHVQGSNPTVYRNAEVFAGTGTVTQDFAFGTDPLYIGCRKSASSFYEFWNGQIANGQYYNRLLSHAEIQQNYNAQKSRFE